MFDWFGAKKRFPNIQSASDLKTNKSSKIQCPSCGRENYSHYKTCLGCGVEIRGSRIPEMPEVPEMPKGPRMDISGSGINVSSVSFGGNSTVTINGQSFQVPGRANVSIKNGKVFINGEPLTDLTGQTQSISIEWKGEPPDNLEVSGNVVIHGDVGGDVSGSNISCGNVKGGVSADGNISCDSVSGDVSASGDVSCDNVDGSVEASGDITCNGNVNGDVSADGDISCKDVGGNVESGGDLSCGNVTGDVSVEGDAKCGDVSGNIDAGGNVSIRRG